MEEIECFNFCNDENGKRFSAEIVRDMKLGTVLYGNMKIFG